MQLTKDNFVKHNSKSIQEVPEINPWDSVEVSNYSQIESASGYITVKGKVTYQNDMGGWSPIREAIIYLYDSDAYGAINWKIGVTTTGEDGSYSFTVLNDDGILEGGLDVWVEVRSQIGYVVGETEYYYLKGKPLLQAGYSGVTSTVSDVPDWTTVDFGTQWVSGSNDIWLALDACLEERRWIQNSVGYTRPTVTIIWPFEELA